MKFEKIEKGMELFDCHSYRMGNTTMRSLGVWPVRVLEVDIERRRAFVSWNGNRPEWYYERDLAKLKKDEPILIRTRMGSRRPTKEERAAILAERKAKATPSLPVKEQA